MAATRKKITRNCKNVNTILVSTKSITPIKLHWWYGLESTVPNTLSLQEFNAKLCDLLLLSIDENTKYCALIRRGLIHLALVYLLRDWHMLTHTLHYRSRRMHILVNSVHTNWLKQCTFLHDPDTLTNFLKLATSQKAFPEEITEL